MKERKERSYGFKELKKKLAAFAVCGFIAIAGCGTFAADEDVVETQVEEVEETSETVETIETADEVIDETEEVADDIVADVEVVDEAETPKDEEIVNPHMPEETVDDAEDIPEENNSVDTIDTPDEIVDDADADATVDADNEQDGTTEDVIDEVVDDENEEISEDTSDVIDVIPEETEAIEEEKSYDYSSEMVGDARAPYFIVDGKVAFCINPDASHPKNGTGYNEISSCLNFDKIFVNSFKMKDVDEDLLNKSMQLAIWSQIKGISYEAAAIAFLGTADIYNALLADVDTSNYSVSYRTFGTELTDAAGNVFQSLISATVEEKEVPTPEPEPTPEPAPEPEPTPEPKPEPTPTPEPAAPEKTTVIEKTKVIEKTVEKVEEQKLVNPDSDWVISDVYVPQTGDTANLTMYACLALLAMVGIIMVMKQNKGGLYN